MVFASISSPDSFLVLIAFFSLTQCVKLMLVRLLMVTIYRHLATYFSFPSAILGDKASGWLGCAVHSMRNITREPMRPSEELKNECLDLFHVFGFVKQSVMTSHSPTARLDSDTMQADASSSKNPTTPPSKRSRFNSEWAEGREWLKYDNENGIMFCECCRCFDRNEYRNQFVKGCASMKLENITNSRGSTRILRLHIVLTLGQKQPAIWT